MNKAVGYLAEITDTRTNETRTCAMECDWVPPSEMGSGSEYVWSEGNFSCDCNRYLFFQRAIDADEDEDKECGDGRYRARCVSLDGVLLYEDDPAE